jgi:adenylate kinase family enzyme
MRVAILGNSGSGKSTLAAWLAARSGAALLDLDLVAWKPNAPAVPRPSEQAQADVRSFCSTHDKWVVEGCYTGLIQPTLLLEPLLLFLHPGVDRCIANCKARPWEPHKYRSRHEQEQRLDSLLDWVRGYYVRDDEMSLAAHKSCFAAYAGRKQEVSDLPGLHPPTESVLSWLS